MTEPVIVLLTHIAKRRVLPLPIVPVFNEVRDGHRGRAMRRQHRVGEAFMSEGGKETCGHRVVPAGTLAAHALPHLIPPPYLIHGRREALTSLRPGWAAVLHVVCDDTGPYAPAGPDAQSLTSDQVTAILQFVRDHLGWRRLVLHCAAGVPRSRSVTAAVAEIVGLPYVWTALNGDAGRAIKAAALAEHHRTSQFSRESAPPMAVVTWDAGHSGQGVSR